MSQTSHGLTDGWTDKDYAVNEALKEAHQEAMEVLRNTPAVGPVGDAGITGLDGRKRLVRRFKRIANETNSFLVEGREIGNRKFQHPNAREEEYNPDIVEGDPEYGKRFRPYTLVYDNQDRCYVLKDEKIEDAETVPQKMAAYDALLDALNRAGFAQDGHIYSRAE